MKMKATSGRTSSRSKVGTTIETGTYYGGTGDDFGNGIALDKDGSIYVTGRSSSNDFPITIGAAPAGNGSGSLLESLQRTGIRLASAR